MNFIVCPLRNGLSLTKKAYSTFLKQDTKDVQVLFINNGSSDGTTEWLNSINAFAAHFPQGLSVAESWNFGLKYAFSWRDFDYALVVNNDVELLPETYRLLVEDGGCFVTAVGVNDREALVYDKLNKRPNPDFSCFLIRREVYETVGPFNENYLGGYCEDWDYHCRMHKAGIEAYTIGIPFLHYACGTIKNASPDEVKAIESQAALNRELFKSDWGFAGGSEEYYDFFKGSTKHGRSDAN